jgi:hypothetical protein
MADQHSGQASRRQVLRLGGVAGTLAAAGPLLGAAQAASAATVARAPKSTAGPAGDRRLPVAEIERIIRAKGTVSNGVLNIEIDRNDIPNVHKAGVPIKPAFQINGNLCFQALDDGSTSSRSAATTPWWFLTSA